MKKAIKYFALAAIVISVQYSSAASSKEFNWNSLDDIIHETTYQLVEASRKGESKPLNEKENLRTTLVILKGIKAATGK